MTTATPTLTLKLNPSLDLEQAAESYRQDGLVQLSDAFQNSSAEFMTALLEQVMPWSWTYWDGEKPVRVPLPTLRAMPQDAYQAQMRSLLERSGEQYGFSYMGYGMTSGFQANDPAGHPIHDVTAFIGSPAFIELGRKITGNPGINAVDAQATLYRPQDFLCRHDDQAQGGSNRVAAYTIGLTRRWRSDWGGQLMFHDDRGDVSRGLVPRWNCLTVFPVPRSHSVATVAPYATGPRMSIIGWFWAN